LKVIIINYSNNRSSVAKANKGDHNNHLGSWYESNTGSRF